MAFHQSLMVEVRDRGIFDVATNIENLINRKECAAALYLADFLSGRPDPRLPRWWIFNHLATFQKAWRQEFKGVVGLDQSRRGKRLKVFVKEFVGFVLAVVSDHWHVDERRAHEKVFFGFLQFHPIHDVPCHLLGLFTFYIQLLVILKGWGAPESTWCHILDGWQSKHRQVAPLVKL